MTTEIIKLMNQYWSWLRDKTVLKETGDWVEITTPFLDRHNDRLQVYVQKRGDDLTLTDDAYVIQDLKLSGCDLNSRKRKDILKSTLNGFGVKLDGDALIVQASPENFPARKHNLMQAMLAVNDMFYMASATVHSLFMEDVEAWLIGSDIRFTPRVKFTGKSGYDHMFDFVIPASKKAPERILQAINRPNRETAESFVLSWIDTREVRAANSAAFAILNDSEFRPNASVLDALRNYEMRPVLWSERDKVQAELAA